MARTEQFLAAVPDFWPAWVEQGFALYQMARYAEAAISLQSALRGCPKRSRYLVLIHLGHMSDAKGEFKQAAKWYRAAARAAPGEASPLIYLGGILVKQERHRDAEKVFRNATECSEGCIDEAYYNLGLVLRSQERYGEAAKCFQEALRRDPKYQPVRRALRDVELAEALGTVPGS